MSKDFSFVEARNHGICVGFVRWGGWTPNYSRRPFPHIRPMRHSCQLATILFVTAAIVSFSCRPLPPPRCAKQHQTQADLHPTELLHSGSLSKCAKRKTNGEAQKCFHLQAFLNGDLRGHPGPVLARHEEEPKRLARRDAAQEQKDRRHYGSWRSGQHSSSQSRHLGRYC